jgi:hypothetical protein
MTRDDIVGPIEDVHAFPVNTAGSAPAELVLEKHHCTIEGGPEVPGEDPRILWNYIALHTNWRYHQRGTA